MAAQKDLRKVVGLAGKLGLPISCLMASLAYFDGYRSAWAAREFIEAQRDDFALIPTSVWMPKAFFILIGNKITIRSALIMTIQKRSNHSCYIRRHGDDPTWRKLAPATTCCSTGNCPNVSL